MIEGPIACVGECMIELTELDAKDGRVRLGFAGDTCNTAIYLSRLLGGGGPSVSYVTAVGRDGLSDRMTAEIEAEGIGTDLVARLEDLLPGIYAIEVDPSGERSFRYWRETSAARMMFSDGAIDPEALGGFRLIYLSGITLAILPETDRARLLDRLRRNREAGGQVAFDGNYRPRLWRSAAEARHWMEAALAVTTIALPSADDEAELFGDADEAATLDRIRARGPEEIAMKRGERGPLVLTAGRRAEPPCDRVKTVVDTTAAGDSFNAGYLAARLSGAAPEEAARAGHALAAQVIGYSGAIMPRSVPLAR